MPPDPYVELLLRAVDRFVADEAANTVSVSEAHRIARALIPFEVIALLDHRVDCSLAVSFVAADSELTDAWLFRTNPRARRGGPGAIIWIRDTEVLDQLRELSEQSRNKHTPHFMQFAGDLFGSPGTVDAALVAPDTREITRGGRFGPEGVIVVLASAPLAPHVSAIAEACGRAVGFARDAITSRTISPTAVGFPPFPASDVTEEMLDPRDLVHLHRLLWNAAHDEEQTDADDRWPGGVVQGLRATTHAWTGRVGSFPTINSRAANRIARAVAALEGANVETTQPAAGPLNLSLLYPDLTMLEALALLDTDPPGIVFYQHDQAAMISIVLELALLHAGQKRPARAYFAVVPARMATAWAALLPRLGERGIHIIPIEDLDLEAVGIHDDGPS